MKRWQLLTATSILAITFGSLSVQQAAAQSASPAPAQDANSAASNSEAGGELQTVEVVATSPLGTGTNALNVPSETQTMSGEEIENLNQPTLQDALARQMPGVSTTDSIGSPISQSVDFRGETATSVPGTPEGLAVYMNGVRINESYGDVVNWDLIPPSAIGNAQIVTGNPVFGLIGLSGQVGKRHKKLSKEKYGTSHIISKAEAKDVFEDGCEALIIGTGQAGNVRLSPEADDFFHKKGCHVILQPTPEAIQTVNESREKKIGFIHVNLLTGRRS